ncbi:OLC1v1015937C1 [Oldenlandia corymbosa var. corymbosa]|uniref:OLC1v1015937C1 n=1 Tax=Oldenlandia corymbosa var. corymbosa TaxID=529605 RepID=A0AAV1E4B1_OLDCO|nr:OLC1v1015937C1 [Oldenlandia corymbosa var. corymbosa]
MFVTAKRSVSVIGGWHTPMDEELSLKQLKDFQRGGKRLRQIQLLNVDQLPIKKIKTAPLSSGAIKEEALGKPRKQLMEDVDDDSDKHTTLKLSGKSQSTVSSSGKQNNIIGSKNSSGPQSFVRGNQGQNQGQDSGRPSEIIE